MPSPLVPSLNDCFCSGGEGALSFLDEGQGDRYG